MIILNSSLIIFLQSNTGKLENFQWKIGVALASNTCSKIFTPYISIRFDIRNNDDTVLPYTTELTYEQFLVSERGKSIVFIFLI